MSFRHQVTKIFKLHGDEQISGESTEKENFRRLKTSSEFRASNTFLKAQIQTVLTLKWTTILKIVP